MNLDVEGSREGLTSEIDHAVDGRGRPLAVVVTGGQSNDGRAWEVGLAHARVPRLGAGQPRSTTDAVLGDKAPSSRGNQEMLHRREIRVVAPETSDPAGQPETAGRDSGRPRKLDDETYKRRNVVERSFNPLNQWRGPATRYDNRAAVYRAGAASQQSSPGCGGSKPGRPPFHNRVTPPASWSSWQKV